MCTTKNEREHIRQSRVDKVVFQIFSSAHDTLPSGTVVRCSTKDVSPRGISFKLDRPLSEGSLLELGVEILDRPGIIFLVGEVKWCKALDESERNLVGVELKERQTNDFKLWQGEFDNWSLFNCDFERV